MWAFTAVCADTKLVPTWLVGERTSDDAEVFLRDLAERITGRIQLLTDGHKMYEARVGQAFGNNVDWAQIQKDYASDPSSGGVENLAHAVSLHFLYYNFARPHASPKDPYPRTPAMAAGVADQVWTLEEIAGLLD